jgi:hypothetical protein
VNGQLTFDDCTPDWTNPVDHQPSDHAPSRFDLRQDEMRDLRDQHAGPRALWTARTIDVGSYL